MAKYTIDFEFAPTLENAPDLLMDLAALISSLPVGQPAEADHSACVARTEHDRLMAEATATLAQRAKTLEWQVGEITRERDQLIANAKKLTADSSINRTLPHPGEYVTILPNGSHQQYYGGVVKKIHGRGGSGGIEVLPKGHPNTIIFERRFIKRSAAAAAAETAA